MWLLSNDLLVDSYYKAVDMKLEQDFIDMLLVEIHRRKLKVKASIRGSQWN